MTERDEPDDLSGELAELRAIAGDLADSPVEWEQPPAELWDRIAGELDIGDLDVAGPDMAEDAVAAAPVTPLRRRGGTLPWVLGAAAAVVVLVLGALMVFGDSDPEPTVVASTTLDQLGPTGSGQAELIDVDGTLRLRVDTADLDSGDGFLEVWMIDPDVTKLISLGPIRADGTYDLPDGLDPADFPVIDVSAEPLDGDPAHSGASLLRGTLVF